MNIQQRFSELQDWFRWFDIGSNGCYLLSLCSIAEQVTGKPADLIGLMAEARIKGEIFNESQEIKDPCKILEFLTGKKWTLEVKSKVPDDVKDEEYTVLKYKWKYTHFRRRGWDTIKDSLTVKNGKLIACYVFTVHS